MRKKYILLTLALLPFILMGTPISKTQAQAVDTAAPVITMFGNNPDIIPLDITGAAYADPGITAIDNVDGDITANTMITDYIYTDVAGEYVITYEISDAAGNTAIAFRKVVVTDPAATGDILAPVITLIGNNPLDVALNGAYIDPGATALDNVDGDVTSSMVSYDYTNSFTSGEYAILYVVSDATGNTSAEVRNTVVAIDTTPPVITLNGNNPDNVILGGTYTDAGATALDNVDGDLTSSIIATNNVDTTVIGTYTVDYSVTDSSGNTATASRTVNVVPPDTVPPVITILGNDPETVIVNAIYTDAGATALDNVDGDLTSSIIATNNVDTTVIGTYTVDYSVTDSSGNTATASRTVNVVDSVPVLTDLSLNATSTSIMVSETYQFLATTTDQFGAPFASTTITWESSDPSVATVDVNGLVTGVSVGTAEVYAYAGSLEAETEVIVTPFVDRVPPVITINGGNSIPIQSGSGYIERGATAVDNIDGAISAIATNTIDTNTLGTQYVIYSATDKAGNTATSSRTVTVVPSSGNSGGGSGFTGGGGGFFPAPIVPTVTIPFPISSTSGNDNQGQVAGVEVFRFTRALQFGMRSDDVSKLQDILRDEGVFNVESTGYFGPITLQAVKDYQEKYGISPQSGYVGTLTIAQLNGSRVLGVSTLSDAQRAAIASQIQLLIQQVSDLESQVRQLNQ